MQTLPVSTVKARLNELARTVATEHERISLTRNGVADTILISAADLDALEATIELLSDPSVMADLAEAKAERERGLSTSSEEMARLLRERGIDV